MINGKRYSWEDIVATLPHGVVIDIKSIEYSDKKEFEEVYGKGSNPVGYGAGNYSAEGKMTILREEFRKFNLLGITSRAFYNFPPFPINVSYANEDQPTSTDVLKGCKITDRSWKGAQGDKSLEVELSFKILDGIYSDAIIPNIGEHLR